MIFYNEKPRFLHLEPTTDCNAKCPQCSRTRKIAVEGDDYIIDEWEAYELAMVLQDPFFSDIKTVSINGNLGDIVMHTHPQDLVECLTHDLKKDVMINTNAGGLPTTFWTWLGKNKKVVHVNFALDGLSDTHDLYRVNTVFDTVLKNAKAYIDAGGTAEWVMTVFPYNEHQVEACRQMALDYGFAKFSHRINVRAEPNEKVINFVHKDKNKDIKYLNKEVSESKASKMSVESNNESISCYVKHKNSVFITGTKQMLPCCWINFDAADIVGYYKYHNIDESSVDLRTKTASQIIREVNGLFAVTQQSWSETPMRVCQSVCGTKNVSRYNRWLQNEHLIKRDDL